MDMCKLEDGICNQCGQTCIGEMGNRNGLVDIKVEGAYDSTHLEDGIEYTFSLCEKCLKQLFDKFLYKPQEKNYFF